MATKIEAAGDTIKIDKVFLSGKDRIAVNGGVVFEDKIVPGNPLAFSVGSREYAIEFRKASKLTGVLTIHLEVLEDGLLVHQGIYDQTGKAADSEEQAKANGAVQACATVGAIVGVTTMLGLNMATGVVPGGAIGGAIGGGGGAALGYGIGSLIFGKRG